MIHIGPLRVDESLAEPTRALLNSNEGVQGAISFLRQQGESKIGTMRILVAVGQLTLAQAKTLVHRSETWRDQREADETLHESLEDALQTLDSFEASSSLPQAR